MRRFDAVTEKILTFLAPRGANCFCSLSEYWDSEADIPIAEVADAVGVSPEAVQQAAEYMVKNGLAEYRILSSRSSRIEVAFRLTHEGLHYREYRRLSAKERWAERAIGFISGLLVSVAGSVIVSLLGG